MSAESLKATAKISPPQLTIANDRKVYRGIQTSQSWPKDLTQMQQPINPWQDTNECQQSNMLDGHLTDDLEDGGSSMPYGHQLDDISIRQRFGELKRKYENLEMRHRDLREVGIKAAECNFERLRNQAETNINDSNELLSELASCGVELRKTCSIVSSWVEMAHCISSLS
ncbi:hypothetical protein RJ55_05852 [Drechmeria coniospora]|nr:hypothetical protein RJ55_05852 [Drechmeria coniospora]